MKPTPSDQIVDLGGGDGAHLASLVSWTAGITVADHAVKDPDVAYGRLGFKTTQLDATARLPFDDGQFAIVFCNSVIEHVTRPTGQVRLEYNEAAFQREGRRHQKQFANEIRRISKSYFVQTPYRYFPIEAHTLAPTAIDMLPRRMKLRIYHWLGKSRLWPREVLDTGVDWILLTISDLHALVPDADIHIEWFAGLPKSIVAVRGRSITG